MKLSSQQRKFLEAQANALEAIVRIGKQGVIPTVVKSVEDALTARELIKIKILDNAEIDRHEAAAILAEETKASIIRVVGRVIILYRRGPDDKKNRIELPTRRPAAKT